MSSYHVTIAASYHEESRDEVRSGVVDDRNEEFSVSDTGWYRMETAVQRELCDQTPLRGWSHL